MSSHRPGSSGDGGLRAHAGYIAFLIVATACCLAIAIMMPERWQPDAIWLMLAPGCGLMFTAIPSMLMLRRQRRIEKRAAEQDELVGFLLRDYAGDRGDWLWSCDAEGRLHGISEKFASKVGRNGRSLENKPFLDLVRQLVPDRSLALAEIETAMRQRKPFFDIETTVRAGQGERWWRLAGKPVFRDSRFGGYRGTASDITDEVNAREKVSFLAYHDGLTGLANRSQFTRRLAECVARLERYGTAFAVLYLDLDKFKAVNDSRGHHAGDQLLIEVGRRLGSVLREVDTVARLGGDEFGVILQEADETAIAEICRRLIEVICQPYAIDNDALMIGLSVGVAIAPNSGTRADQILRNADLALYRAKSEGGNRHRLYESRMDAEIRERRVLELELAEAVEGDQFVLYYQPLVRPADGTVAGFEALIRWNHPIRGLVPPSEFIPIAERSTLINGIGEWTIAEACRMLTRLPEHLTLAVNLSTKHFASADMTAMVAEALEATGAAPHRLELEITESLLIDNPEEMADKLRELQKMGCKVAMDDFGTGFSSLSYLLKFPFDKIKIDRSFVSASSEDAAAREILRAIVNLAATLEIDVTAEGVETEEQADFLRETNCNLLQGYYFSRPMPEASMLAYLGGAVMPEQPAAALRGRTSHSAG